MKPGNPLMDGLPILHRLALSYAPAAAREQVLALMALDLRLAGIVRSSHEPMLAQLRLAWWREQLGSDGSAWPEGEPLLVTLRSWQGRHGDLQPLVDGWEGLTGPAPLPVTVFEQLAEARGRGFAAIAQDDAAVRPGRNWALVDLAFRLSHPEERAGVLALARAQDWSRPRLPRSLRSLAVLHAMAARRLRREADGDRMTPGDLATAMRVGFLGA